MEFLQLKIRVPRKAQEFRSARTLPLSAGWEANRFAIWRSGYRAANASEAELETHLELSRRRRYAGDARIREIEELAILYRRCCTV